MFRVGLAHYEWIYSLQTHWFFPLTLASAFAFDCEGSQIDHLGPELIVKCCMCRLFFQHILLFLFQGLRVALLQDLVRFVNAKDFRAPLGPVVSNC